jgi:S-DNA-T family DNA segregation ATPase FtsK/SpoIIIE
MSKVKEIIGKQPSATVNFYDMPDGTVMTEVDMCGEYRGTDGQMMASRVICADPLYYNALKIAVEDGKLCVSQLQRVLFIGYNRAYRLIKELISRGVVEEYKTDHGIGYRLANHET